MLLSIVTGELPLARHPWEKRGGNYHRHDHYHHRHRRLFFLSSLVRVLTLFIDDARTFEMK